MPQAESVRWLERQRQGHAEAEQTKPGGLFWRSGNDSSGFDNSIRRNHDAGTNDCLRHIGGVK